MRLLLENIRGFQGQRSLQIKPITILVGENSSGKSTLLGAISAAMQRDFPTSDVFNRAPFEWGGYDTIATYRGGKFGKAKHFSVGLHADNGEVDIYNIGVFENDQGLPKLSRIYLSNTKGRLDIEIGTGTWHFDFPEEKFSIQINDPNLTQYGVISLAHSLLVRRKELKIDDQLLRRLTEFIYSLSDESSEIPRVVALAPLRSKPYRTYDKSILEIKPEGDHIPLVLSKILSSEKEASGPLLDAIRAFGKASGLFENLRVRRMGKQASDPFQVRVKSVAGPDANLVDVGYGVSQALPIIIDSLRATPGSVVLVQQPEVHLHPRAQAALGSFFCAATTPDTPKSQYRKRFVIETHSDYLVDRVRMTVADGKIDPNDVNIVFLDRNGIDITIYELQLDDQGNITDAPDSYRKFFLEEEMRLLMRGSP